MIQHDQVKESLRHPRLQIAREHLGGGEYGVRGPRLRLGQVQHILPIGKRWDNLERFRQLARLVPRQQHAHFCENFYDLFVQV